MTDAGFDRGRRASWLARSAELVWVFELDRGRSWSPWSMTVAAAVRAWAPGVERPRSDGGQVVIDYSLLGSAVPDDAAGSRFDDHRSYFTMVFDHTHDLVPVEERARAFEWMAADLQALVSRSSSLEQLRQAVAAGAFNSGFLDPRLRSDGR